MPEEHHSHWKLITGIIIGAIILIVALTIFFIKNGDYTTQTVISQDFVRQIEVTGEVIPAEDVNLSFVTSGRISDVFVTEGQTVSTGDVLLHLDASETEADLRQALADRSLRSAELDALVGVRGDAGRYDSVKRESANLIQKAFNVADNQIKTNIDVLYDDAQSGRPKVTFAITEYFTRQHLNQQRFAIGNTLEDWSSYISSVNNNSISETDLDHGLENLQIVRNFLEDISNALSEAEAVSGISESTVSGFRSNVTNARSAINTVIDEVVAIRDTLRDAQSDIPVKEAQISASQAAIERLEAALNDFVLIAPFDGIIVDVPVITGEIVAANQIAVSLISETGLELEVFIPEVQIADLGAADTAEVTFDAFADAFIASASVVHVDARATERDGIPTYKTILEIIDADSDMFVDKLRAGMTANITIEAIRIPDVVIIPNAVVERQAGRVFVEVLEEGRVREREVLLGRRDTSGGIEVVGGLTAGDELVVSR